MLKGFVEGVDAYQARGWVYDKDFPNRVFSVEIWKRDIMIGQVVANLFRADLAQAGIGDGRHAFIYNMNEPQTEDDRADIVVKAVCNHEYVTLDRLAGGLDLSATEVKSVAFEGIAVDHLQAPVFVIGAARSGTSAVAQAFLKIGYEGHREGHFFDLLASWSVSLTEFLDLNGDEYKEGRDTMLARFAPDYLNQSLDEVFVKAAQRAYPSRQWIDKTPNSNMVHLAPRFLRMWPNAKFIFMKRRFFENVASRSRKFPEYNFAVNCFEWSNAMRAWLDVRDQISVSAIEIDQFDLMNSPEQVAGRIAAFVGWSRQQQEIFVQALKYDWPERTSQRSDHVVSLDEMNWSEQQLALYSEMCAPMMNRYGYTEDKRYRED